MLQQDVLFLKNGKQSLYSELENDERALFLQITIFIIHKQATMTLGDLYIKEDYDSIILRINKLNIGSKPEWGTMDVAKMFAHCSEVQEVINGKRLKKTPFMVSLLKGFIKKAVVEKKPYKRNLQTHPQYRMQSDKNFETEKQRLLAALKKFHELDREKTQEVKHSLFGKMTLPEKGWGAYKHIDHHLVQFGI